MKFEALKKARWTLTIGGYHRGERVGNWFTGYSYKTYRRGFSFNAEVEGKHFSIHYWDGHRKGDLLRPMFIYDVPINVSDEEVIDWVEKQFTPNGFEALYDTIFNDTLKNF